MAAIFQIRRGSGSVSLVDGELYLDKSSGSLQVSLGNGNPITLARLDQPNSGSLNLSGDITASNAYISGNLHISGNLILGNSGSDTITATGEFTSNLIPNPTDTHNLGSDSKRWGRMFINSVSASAFTGSLFGMGDPTSFSTSVDLRLDRVEASSSLYDNAMSGSNRLYVSPSGSDSYDGKDPSTPFRTIKAAVESLGSAIASNIQRTTIFIGSGNYTENNPIAVPPGVAIVGDTLRTVRLTASNPTKDYFHCHDSNYFYGLRFLDLKHPAFAFSYPCSTAIGTISAGGVSGLTMIHTESGYVNGESVNVIIEGPDASGSVATATATVSGGTLSINMVSNGSGYVVGEKPHISIQAPSSKRPVIGTSPYIQNCSSITGPITTDGTALSLNPASPNYAPLPYNINDVRNASNAVIGSGIIDEQGAGGGIRIDGNLVSGSSPLESFVADAFTQVNQGGPGHLVINKGYAQFVSCFTTFCTYGFKVANGGFANISNSVIDFGAKGLVSKTYFPQTYNTGSSSQTLTSTVVGAVIQQDGAGYTGSVATVTITGGEASVNATAEATVNANGSIDEIVILTPGSGYKSQPTLTIAAPTGPGAIQATTVAEKAEISGIAAILFQLESGSRGIDISSNMILSGSNYLVTNVATGSSANERYVTVYPAPPSITTGDNVYFHQLSNISTGGLVMEYVGSGVTYNALPKFGGVPNRNREIVEYAPGRVFYSTVDNIGNLKIGDFFAVNQLTGEVTIDANQFNLGGLSAIGPFKRNGVGVGVVLNEVSNNTTLLNAQGITGEDTVPTQFAVKGYIDIRDARLNKLEQTSGSLNAFSGSTLTRLGLLETSTESLNTFSSSTLTRLALLETSTGSLNSYTASLKQAITVTGTDAASTTTIKGNLVVQGTQTTLDSTTVQIGDNIIELNGTGIANGGLLIKDPTAASTISGSLLWDSTLDYWKGGTLGNESKLLLAGGDSVISGSSQIANLGYATTGSNSFNGSQSINGNLYLTGSLIPSGNFVYDLGSPTNGFGDVYLSSSTVYMNNNPIFGTTDVVPVEVGDYLQGGIVYYVDTVNGFSYIVNKDDIGEVNSSNFTRVAGANSSVLGGGITNTNAITASTGGQQNPAKLCSDFTGGGYTDWYLPSTRELALIASNTNLMAASLAGVRYVRYWSSTADSDASKTYYAGDGNKNDYLFTNAGLGNGVMFSVPDNRTSVGFVKAVRRTNLTSIIRTLSFPNFNFSGSINVEGTIGGIAIGAFVTQSNERITNLESSSLNLNIVSSSLNSYTASLNTYTTSVDSRFTTLGIYTGSIETRFTALENTTSSLNTFSASALTRLNRIEESTSSLNTFSASVNGHITDINTKTGSFESKFNAIGYTTSSLNTFSASMDAFYNNFTASLANGGFSASVDYRLNEVEYTASLFGGGLVAQLDKINQATASLQSFTASANSRLTNLESTTASLNSSVSQINSFTSSANSRLNNIEAVTSSYETNGRGIVSGSSQITLLLPSGVVSGSSQVLNSSNVLSGSNQTYITTINQNLGTTSSGVQFATLGIGTTPDATYELKVEGDIAASGDIVAYNTSDKRLKNNIEPIVNALDKLNQLGGYTFEWNEELQKARSGKDLGVIAQEVQSVFPEVVIERENGYLAVDYEKLVPVLIEAIKELSAKLKELEKK
jgi:hypothetical protein